MCLALNVETKQNKPHTDTDYIDDKFRMYSNSIHSNGHRKRINN